MSFKEHYSQELPICNEQKFRISRQMTPLPFYLARYRSGQTQRPYEVSLRWFGKNQVNPWAFDWIAVSRTPFFKDFPDRWAPGGTLIRLAELKYRV